MEERAMKVNILIAEDDPNFRNLICDILQKQGYEPISTANGKQAVDLFHSRSDIALCILDVMMPQMDGWEVVNEIRKKSNLPILMLTALGDDFHEIKGLNLGADDYIVKPFSLTKFIARVEVLLRRTKKEHYESIALGKVSLNIDKHKVFIDDIEVYMNNKEFSLLNLLMKNAGIVLNRDKIIERIWGYDFEGDYRTVDAHIKMIRSKHPILSKSIVTIRGLGYKFEVFE